MESVHEEWRAVKGFEGQYEVSDQGRVRSLSRTVACRNRSYHCEGKVLKCNVNCTTGPGYPMVRLGDSSLHQTKYVHSLVLEAFIGPRPPRYEACHCNGIRTDNRLENLRWDSPRANQMDRVKHGTSNRGERCGSVKLTEAQAKEILQSTDRGCDLAKRFGVSQQTICNLRKGRRWAHLRETTAA